MLNQYAPGIVSLRDALDLPDAFLELAYEIASHDSRVAAALNQHDLDVSVMMGDLKRAARP